MEKMIKIKMFSSYRFDNLEKAINDFFILNTNITIIKISQSIMVNDIIISIVYEIH